MYAYIVNVKKGNSLKLNLSEGRCAGGTTASETEAKTSPGLPLRCLFPSRETESGRTKGTAGEGVPTCCAPGPQFYRAAAAFRNVFSPESRSRGSPADDSFLLRSQEQTPLAQNRHADSKATRRLDNYVTLLGSTGSTTPTFPRVRILENQGG